MNNSVIYISRRCPHCQELLIAIHKNRDIFNFRIVDIDKEAFPKMITTVPSMLIGNKVLPGQELFKFLTYLINQKNENTMEPDRRQMEPDRRQMEPDRRQMEPDRREIEPDRRQMEPDRRQMEPDRREMEPDRRQMEPERMMGQPDRDMGSHDKQLNNVSNDESGDSLLDGFAGFDGLGFSMIDDEDNLTNLDTNAEFLDSDNLDKNNKPISIEPDKGDYRSEKRNQFDSDYEEMMKSRGIDNGGGNMSMRTF